MTRNKVRTQRKRKVNSKKKDVLFPIQNYPEIKTVDFNDGGSPPGTAVISTTPVFILANAVALGSDVFQRVGRKIMMKSLHVIGNVTYNVAKTPMIDYFRVLVIYDRQPPLSTIAPILQSIDVAGNATSTSYDFHNLATTERFDILADVRYAVNPASGVLGNGSISLVNDAMGEYNFDRLIPMRNFTAHYDSAAVGTAPITGAVYVAWVGSIAAAGAPYTFNVMTRLKYHDL